MERLMKFIKRKNHIEYDMNCIDKYIHGGDHDSSLQRTWDELERELEEVNKEIKLLSNSKTKEMELKKLELMDQIHTHEVDIAKLKKQVVELENILLTKV